MLSEKQIRSKFDIFNKLYFDNALPQPKTIEFKFVKKFLGQFQWYGRYGLSNSRCTIRFSTAWDMTDFEVEKVLIHEMVHEWQWINGYRDHHGISFKSKASEINNATSNKYQISRRTALENNTCLKTKSDFNGCIVAYKSKKIPGKILVAKMSADRLSKFMLWIPTHPSLSDVHFYYASGDIYKNWKGSVKILHGYPFSEEDFNIKIKSTISTEIL